MGRMVLLNKARAEPVGEIVRSNWLMHFEPQISQQDASTLDKTRWSCRHWIFVSRLLNLPHLRFLLSYTAFVSGVFL